MRYARWAVLAATVAAVLTAGAAPSGGGGADDKAVEEQYMALAVARTKAELAIRKAREGASESEKAWRQMWQAIATAREKAFTTAQHLLEQEARLADDIRSEQQLQERRKRIETLQSEWQKFEQVAHPEIQERYQKAMNLTNVAHELFQNLVNVERMWKDAGIDLAPLQQSYDAVGKRAVETRQMMDKALLDLQGVQKVWEDRAAEAAKAEAAVKAGG